jgi:hypothetical protein
MRRGFVLPVLLSLAVFLSVISMAESAIPTSSSAGQVPGRAIKQGKLASFLTAHAADPAFKSMLLKPLR